MPHVPGLDGLRAIAVLAVLAYHLDLGWAGGGFLGVEVFFTLSGFLITQLLVAELRRRGRVDAVAFARARARRLVPALVACVVATVLVFRQVAPAEVPGLRGDALAALGYVQNWHLVLTGIPYAESFERPSPLLHLWSLSIEGQLYLVWPLLFVGVLALRRRWVTVVLTLLLAIGSAVALAVQYAPDGANLTYYATDARASGFLVGAALALAWRPEAWQRPLRWYQLALIDLLGLLALAGLLVGLATASEFDTELYLSGGFLRTGLVTAVLILAATRSRSVVAGILGSRLAVAVGKRSYGLYLYHWPVFVLFRDLPGSTVARDVLAVLVTVAVTELSYRLLETPIRRGGIRSLAARAHVGRQTLVAAAAVGAVGLVSLTVACTAPVPDAVDSSASPSVSAYSDSALPDSAPIDTTPPEVAPPPDPAPPPVTTGEGPALVVGDSIVLGSAGALSGALGPGTTVDAKVGRQFAAAPSIVAGWVRQNTGPIVVDLGANGTVQQRDVDAILDAAGTRRVVLVGVAVDRRWREPNNDVLRAAAAANAPRVVFVDWSTLVRQHPGVLGPDGVHPLPQGRDLLATAVAEALR